MSARAAGTRGILVAVFSALLLLFGPVAPASAHVDLDNATPSLGEIVLTTPDTITLELSGEPGNIDVNMYHRDGRPVPLTGSGPVIDGRTVTVTPPALDIGTYVVTWSSVGPDGHAAAGQTHFSVGVADGTPGDMSSALVGGSSPVDTGLTWLSYAALAGLLGAAWLRLTGLVGRPRRLQLLVRASALALLATTVVRFAVVAWKVGATAGPLTGAGLVLSTPQTAAGWAILAAAAVALLLLTRPAAVLPLAVAAAAAMMLVGHLGTDPAWLLLVPLATVHLLGVCLWLGAPAAHLLAGSTGRAAHFEFAKKFTVWAAAAAAAVAVSGVALTLTRSGPDALMSFFDYRYGQTLLLKWFLLLSLVAPLAVYHLARVAWHYAAKYQASLSGAAAAKQDDEAAAPDLSDDSTAASESAGQQGTPGHAPVRARGLSGLTLLIETVVLVVILALGASLAGLSPKPPATLGATTVAGGVATDLLAVPASFEECTSGGEADQLLCMARYFEGVAQGPGGMPKALEEIANRWQNGDEWMLKNCHAIGHKLGRFGFRLFQDIKTAFSQGSDPCDYGYLHGVIEGASSDYSDAQMLAAMTTMCEPVADGNIGDHTYRQCIHGLGHAAARRVNNDLKRGSEFCRPFYRADIQPGSMEELKFSLCITGLSMEWNTQRKALDAMTLPIGAPGTLMFECLQLDKIFQSACLEYGTSAMGGVYEREIAAREWCDKNLDDPLPCYRSIGRDVIWSPTITNEQAVEICMGGRPGRYAEECLERSLGSVATIALDADAIDKFCPYIPDQYKHLCKRVKDAMVVQLEQTTRGYILGNGDDITRKEPQQ